MSNLYVNIRVGRRYLLVWRDWHVAIVLDQPFFKYFPDAPWLAVYKFFGLKTC